jgi:hypothetical protein
MSETNERGTLDENPEETRTRCDESRQGSSKASRESPVRADGGATDNDRRRETGGQARQEEPGPGEGFARATTRWLLAIVGLFVVLFAVGQAFGVPLLSWVGEALSSQTGQWLVVAFVGLLIVYAAANLDWR